MFVTYQITNTITGEYYIGSHKTDNPDDDYLGSGVLIKKSIQEYGREAHIKTILGSFETREESLNLEHALIKRRKDLGDSKLLNKSFGGSSFDYINENLSFNRVAFGKLATQKNREIGLATHEQALLDYLRHPKYCKTCNKLLDYNKRHNSFCSSSCSATYNNSHRCLSTESGLKNCKFCGKSFLPTHKNAKFCSRICSTRGQSHQPNRLTKKAVILQDIELIVTRRQTESLRKIAKDYNVAAMYLLTVIKAYYQTK